MVISTFFSSGLFVYAEEPTETTISTTGESTIEISANVPSSFIVTVPQVINLESDVQKDVLIKTVANIAGDEVLKITTFSLITLQ